MRRTLPQAFSAERRRVIGMNQQTPAAPLTNRVALVTGGGSGIGRETALAFARAGAAVMVADINPNSSEETAALIRDAARRPSRASTSRSNVRSRPW
jgi:NAD(P)-dependent dehydrogenase (short-subunit alcohol dehydrogenase family)